MRHLYLLFGIVCGWLASYKSNAQWEKMPIGTKLYYKYQYSIYKFNLNESEDTINSKSLIRDIKIDTVIILSGKDRKLVLFSDVFDPYGSSLFGIRNEFKNISVYDLFDKEKCSLFYYFKDAIYGVEVSKQVKGLLMDTKILGELDDSLRNAVFYSNTDTLLNYWVRGKNGQMKVQFKIQGYDFIFQPFKLLKGQEYRKKSDSYTLGTDPFSDFYGLRYKRNDVDVYVYTGGHWYAQLYYSYKKGIISSKAFAGGGEIGINFKMKLLKVEYPINHPKSRQF